MKKYLLAAVLAAFWMTNASAFGGSECNGLGNCNEDNSISNKAYGGDGGNAKAKAKAKAEADARAKAVNKTKVSTSVHTQQKTEQDQKQGQLQGQLQGQVGIVKNVGPQVVITDKSVVTYEAAASSAIAPDTNAPDPTAQCRFSQGFSVAGSAVMAGGSIGHSTSEYDPICGAWMAASQTTGNAKTVATTVAYCMTMEETGVEVAECDDWKGKVGRGLTENGTWVAASATVAKVEEEEAEVVAFAGTSGDR